MFLDAFILLHTIVNVWKLLHIEQNSKRNETSI